MPFSSTSPSAPSRSSAHRNAASVLPDPVGADSSTCSPLAIAGQACAWAGVGSANEASNHARVGGLNAASGSDFSVATSAEASAQAPSGSSAGCSSGCWNISEERAKSVLGIVPLDCRSVTDDETQQSPPGGALGRRLRPRSWMRWLTGAVDRKAAQDAQDKQADEPLSVDETLHALPGLLDGANLPDGVVELVIEDSEAARSRLLDIHDGHVKLAEPGQCVPWASIAGPATAWTMALGPERDTKQLRLTGDEQLARRVLAALPRGD
jgi:hypothetical protein